MSAGTLVRLLSVWKWLQALITGTALLLANPACAEPGESRWLDRYIDPQDGQFDLSDHLLKYRGLLPVPIIITEPALGYGGGIAALWFKESMEEAGARSRSASGQPAPPASSLAYSQMAIESQTRSSPWSSTGTRPVGDQRPIS